MNSSRYTAQSNQTEEDPKRPPNVPLGSGSSPQQVGALTAACNILLRFTHCSTQRLDTLAARASLFGRSVPEGYLPPLAEEGHVRRYSNPLPGVRDLIDIRKNQSISQSGSPNITDSSGSGVGQSRLMQHSLGPGLQTTYLPVPSSNVRDPAGLQTSQPLIERSYDQPISSAPSAPYGVPLGHRFQPSSLVPGIVLDNRGLSSLGRVFWVIAFFQTSRPKS